MLSEDRGTVLMLFPAAFLVMIVLGALVVDVSLSQVRATELDAVAASAANDALAALDLQRLRATGEALIEPDAGARITQESIANGALPDARLVAVSVDYGGGVPVLSVTLELEVDFVMAPALPNGLDSTTITRTKSVSILG